MSFVSPLESRERARKRRDSKSTEPAHTREKVYLDSMYNRLLTKRQERRRPTFVKSIAPGGPFERTSWVKPKSDRGDQTVERREEENPIDDEGDADIRFCKLYGEKRE